MNFDKDLVRKVEIAVLATLVAHFDLDEREVSYEDDTKLISDNNLYNFSHALMDVHDVFDLPVDYEDLKEFDLFPTVGDFIYYICAQLSSDIVELDSENVPEDTKKVIEEIISSILAVICTRANVTLDDFDLTDNLLNLVNDDVAMMNIIIEDVNSKLKTEIDISPVDYEEQFSTIKDIIDYYIEYLVHRNT